MALEEQKRRQLERLRYAREYHRRRLVVRKGKVLSYLMEYTIPVPCNGTKELDEAVSAFVRVFEDGD